MEWSYPWIFYTTGYEHKETPLCSVGMVTARVGSEDLFSPLHNLVWVKTT